MSRVWLLKGVLAKILTIFRLATSCNQGVMLGKSVLFLK